MAHGPRRPAGAPQGQSRLSRESPQGGELQLITVLLLTAPKNRLAIDDQDLYRLCNPLAANGPIEVGVATIDINELARSVAAERR